MPDLIEDEIRHVLDGQGAQTAPDDLCDFSLEDQNNVVGTGEYKYLLLKNNYTEITYHRL